MAKVYFNFSILVLFCLSLPAQNNFKADSLKCIELAHLAETAEEGEWQKCNQALFKLCMQNIPTYSNVAKKDFFRFYRAKAFANFAYDAAQRNDTSNALAYYAKAKAEFKQLRRYINLAESQCDQAQLHYKNGQNLRALALLMEAEQNIQNNPDTSLYIEILNLNGIIHRNNANIALALQNYYAALKLAEAQKDDYRISFLKSNIAVVFSENGEHEQALKNFREVLGVRQQLLKSAANAEQKTKLQSSIASSLTSVAIEYYHLQQNDSSRRTHQKAFVLRQMLNDKRGMAETWYQLGLLFEQEKNYDSAFVYYQKSFVLSKEMNDLQMLCNTCNFISISLFRKNQKAEALQNALECHRYALQLAYPGSIQTTAQSLKFIYLSKGSYKEALEMMELEIRMRDSISNEENKKASIKSQLKYEYEKKAAADSVKAAEEKKVVDAQLKQEKTQRLALYGGLGLVGIFALFMVNRFRVTNKQKKLIEEQKKTVEAQKHLVEEKQKEILDSIKYARRIQNALITNEHYIKQQLTRIKG